MEVPLDEMQNHNCVQDLRHTLMAIIYELKGKITTLEAELERVRGDGRHTTPITDNQAPGASNGVVAYPAPALGREGAAPNPHNLSDEEIRWGQGITSGE